MKVIKIRWITSYFWKIFHSVNSLFSIFNPSFSLIYHPCVEIYAYSSVCVSFLLYSVYYVSDSTVFMCPSLCLCVSLSVMPVFNLYNCLGRHTKVVFLVVGPLRSGDTPPTQNLSGSWGFRPLKKNFLCVSSLSGSPISVPFILSVLETSPEHGDKLQVGQKSIMRTDE